MATAWEEKHQARFALDAYQDAYAAARERGLSSRDAGKAANVAAKRARERYAGRGDRDA